jgi:hypothetical protein
MIVFMFHYYYYHYGNYLNYFVGATSTAQALLRTLEPQQSARRKGKFALYNCFVLGHTTYNGVQRVCHDPFHTKLFYGSHQMDLIMIRPPGIETGAFVVSSDSVWHARVWLLFSATAGTDAGQSHLIVPSYRHCQWKRTMIPKILIIVIMCIICIILIILFLQVG